MTAYQDPLAYIRRYEAGDNYEVLWGGGSLVGLPADEYGFPQWAGKSGSHAAGAYQFQPGTWRLYASRLGITDFSPRSQDAVAVACYASRGFADWLPYNPKLAQAVKIAGGPAMFSLGATAVTMMRNAPPPLDGGLVIHEGDSLEVRAGDKRFRLAVKVGAAVVVMAMAAATIKGMMPAETAAAQWVMRYERQSAWLNCSWEPPYQDARWVQM